MRRRHFERHLAAQGCRKVREGADHTIWASGSDPRRRAPLPRHREIDRALVRAICKQLGVPAP